MKNIYETEFKTYRMQKQISGKIQIKSFKSIEEAEVYKKELENQILMENLGTGFITEQKDKLLITWRTDKGVKKKKRFKFTVERWKTRAWNRTMDLITSNFKKYHFKREFKDIKNGIKILNCAFFLYFLFFCIGIFEKLPQKLIGSPKYPGRYAA